MSVYKAIQSLDPGYFVDENGDILFVSDYTPREDGLVILEPGKYRRITISTARDGHKYFRGYLSGKRRTIQVTRVVAEAFKEGYSRGRRVYHYGDVADNSVTNLHFGFRKY